jgi:hypothetical protein
MMVVPVMAAVTEHIGFGVTANLTYEPPYLFARRMSTLDHKTGGRVGWNIVTGYLDSAARGMGRYALWRVAARTQEARHDSALHPRRHQRARRGDKPARLPAEDARLTRGRCRGQRSRWRTSSAAAGRLGVPLMPAM